MACGNATCSTNPYEKRTSDRSAHPKLTDLTRASIGLVNLWFARHRQRRALGRLDTRLLHDIGVSPATAAREARKPFWRA